MPCHIAVLQAAAADCAVQAAAFRSNEATGGPPAADELSALFLPLARGHGAAPEAGASAGAHTGQAFAASLAPLMLLQLQTEVLITVLFRLDTLTEPGSRRCHMLQASPRPAAADDTHHGGAAAACHGALPGVPEPPG